MKTPAVHPFAIAPIAALLLAMVGTPSIAQVTAAATDTTVQHPAGGWTHSGISDDPDKVSYAYPNNLIDRGGQRGRTLIVLAGEASAFKPSVQRALVNLSCSAIPTNRLAVPSLPRISLRRVRCAFAAACNERHADCQK